MIKKQAPGSPCLKTYLPGSATALTISAHTFFSSLSFRELNNWWSKRVQTAKSFELIAAQEVLYGCTAVLQLSGPSEAMPIGGTVDSV